MHTNDQRNTSTEMACGLAGEVVRTFGKVRLRVFGTSMVPSILPGDLIVIQRAGVREISPGEVVLFSRMGRLFVHRVVDRKVSSASAGLDETFLITRGDLHAHDDPPVSSRDLLGRVVSVERDNRKVELPARTDGSSHCIARLLRASDRATYLYPRLAACRQTIFLKETK